MKETTKSQETEKDFKITIKICRNIKRHNNVVILEALASQVVVFVVLFSVATTAVTTEVTTTKLTSHAGISCSSRISSSGTGSSSSNSSDVHCH